MEKDSIREEKDACREYTMFIVLSEKVREVIATSNITAEIRYPGPHVPECTSDKEFVREVVTVRDRQYAEDAHQRSCR